MQEMGAEKKTFEHSQYEYPVLEKVRMQTFSFARMDLEQMKEARLSGIMALGKGVDS